MAYVYLALAIIFEILGMMSMKYSNGFNRIFPVVLILISYIVSFIFLTLSLKSLPISVVYTVWAGAGIVVMTLVGLFVFGEPLPVQKVFATSLIILGVIMLNFTENQDLRTQEQVVEIEKFKQNRRVSSEADSSEVKESSSSSGNRNSG